MPFVKGRSGNPTGRPRGFAGVARQIMDSTRGGAELVDWALGVWRDPGAEMRDRVDAHRWLADRGLGKPLATVDVNHAADAERDLSGLTDAQIDELEAIEADRDARAEAVIAGAAFVTAARDVDDRSSSENTTTGTGWQAQSEATP